MPEQRLRGRKLLIERIAVIGLTSTTETAGVSVRTARKWLMRFEQAGPDGLLDRSSRPHQTRGTVNEAHVRRIEQLRRTHMPMRAIAAIVGRSVATVSRVLARLGLPASRRSIRPRRRCVTSAKPPANPCTSTPRSSAAWCAQAIA